MLDFDEERAFTNRCSFFLSASIAGWPTARIFPDLIRICTKGMYSWFCMAGCEKQNQLGAKIDQHIGDNEEIHMVTTPIAIVGQAVFTHTPVIAERADRPYGFFPIRRDTGEIYSPMQNKKQ